MGARLTIVTGRMLPALALALLAMSPGVAELPPDVQADLYLVEAERQIGEDDYKGAAKTLGKILALSREHGFEIPPPFWFKHASVLMEAGDIDQAEKSAVQYIKAAGRGGEHYVESLGLLDRIKQAQAAEAKKEAERKAERDKSRREAEHSAAAEAARRKAKAEPGSAEEVARRWPAGKLFKDALRSGGEGPQMAVLPAGSFRMGCLSNDDDCFDNEKPVRTVWIVRPFAVSVYEATFEDYDRFTRATGGRKPRDKGWGRGRRPVIDVSWEDAQAYVAWLSEQTGADYWLLSEAEWEYAARAGSTTKYSWGDEVGTNRTSCDGCGSRWDNSKRTAPVGSFEPNGFGLYDMHGNVAEWVADCWNDSYEGAPFDGSAWMQGDCELRVSRGGGGMSSLWRRYRRGWGGDPRYLRSANRNSTTNIRFIIGFRVARTLAP